jgi:hypothetical protein
MALLRQSKMPQGDLEVRPAMLRHHLGMPALQAGAAALFYAAAALLLMGSPLAHHFSTTRLGDCAPCDPEVYLWSLKWFPHALHQGLPLLFTTAAFAPGGYNLAWSTAMPGASLLMAPITRAFGPMVAYNVLSIAAPAISALATFFLCRTLTGAFWPSLAGGWLFGFSPYAQLETIDHLHLALDFVAPLLLCLALLRYFDRLSRPRFVILAAVLLVVQFSLSAEIFATSILFGAAALALGRLIAPAQARRSLRSLAALLLLSCAFALVALCPYLVHLLGQDFNLLPVFNPAHCSTDLAGFVTPGPYTMLGHWLALNRSWGCEPMAWMGLLPAIALALLLDERRRWPIRLLFVMLILVCIAALGPVIHFKDHALIPGPSTFILLVPLLNNALPARFMMYAFLLMALAIALFLAAPGHRLIRWLAAIAALVSVAPTIPFRWRVTPYQPPFITEALYRQAIHPRDVVLILPWGQAGEAMLWQAESDFHFRLAGGYLGGVMPREYKRWPIVQALQRESPYILDYGAQFQSFLAAHQVRAVIVEEPAAGVYARLCALLGTPLHLGGVLLYRVPADARFPDAQTMETRYCVGRFERMLAAVRGYLAHGGSPAGFDLQAVATAGVLGTSDLGQPAPAQLPAFGWLHRVKASMRFQRAVALLQRRWPLRYRAAVELGPVPIVPTDTGIWAGPWPGRRIAVGEACAPEAARRTIAALGSLAEHVFYPYPAPYGAAVKIGADPQFLLMVMRPEAVLGAKAAAR